MRPSQPVVPGAMSLAPGSGPPSGAKAPVTAPEVPTITVYLAVGSNLDDRVALISAGVEALWRQGILRNWCLSPIYETDPVVPPGSPPQPPYLNAVIRGETHLGAPALLAACLQIEAALGRVRPPDRLQAPRKLDIDVLLYGAEVIQTPTLKVPHPRLLGRPFVRIPLADVALPGLVHPVDGVPLAHAPPSPTVRALVTRPTGA